MDVGAVNEILKSAYLKGAFQAFLVTARANGVTVQTLADELGVSKRTMFRYLAKIRDTKPRNPRDVELVDKPAGDSEPCSHTDAFYLGRKRICLKCLKSNLDAELRQQRQQDEREERELNRVAAKFRPKTPRRKQA